MRIPFYRRNSVVIVLVLSLGGCLGREAAEVAGESRPASLEIRGLDLCLNGREEQVLLKGADYSSAMSSAYVQKPLKVVNWPDLQCGAVLIMLNRQDALVFVDWSVPDHLKFSGCLIFPWGVRVVASPNTRACLIVSETDLYHSKEKESKLNLGILYVDFGGLSWHDSMEASLAWENRDRRWEVPSSRRYEPEGHFSLESVKWMGASCRAVVVERGVERVISMP